MGQRATDGSWWRISQAAARTAARIAGIESWEDDEANGTKGRGRRSSGQPKFLPKGSAADGGKMAAATAIGVTVIGDVGVNRLPMARATLWRWRHDGGGSTANCHAARREKTGKKEKEEKRTRRKAKKEKERKRERERKRRKRKRKEKENEKEKIAARTTNDTTLT